MLLRHVLIIICKCYILSAMLTRRYGNKRMYPVHVTHSHTNSPLFRNTSTLLLPPSLHLLPPSCLNISVVKE